MSPIRSLVVAVVLTTCAAVAAPRAAHAGGESDEVVSQRLRDRLDAIERQLDQQRNQARTERFLADRFLFGREYIDSLKELIEAFRELNAGDRDYDPDLRPAGAPDVPVSCQSEQCGACYEQAQEALRAALFKLEKLRTIYARTTKMAKKANSFGDTYSTVAPGFAVGWGKAKLDIDKSVKRLENAYDAKLPELLDRAKDAIDAIGDCEAEHFANPDWYNRYGFIYEQFLRGRYARPDP